MLLWRTVRDVALWGETPAEDRSGLRALLAELREAGALLVASHVADALEKGATDPSCCVAATVRTSVAALKTPMSVA